MTLPEAEATQFINSLEGQLNDHTLALDDVTLRRIEREALRLLKDAPTAEICGVLWSVVSNARFRRQAFTGALDAARNGLQYLPNDAMLMVCEAASLLELKRYEQARSLFERALSVATDPAFEVFVAANLAEAFYLLGDRQRAWEAMRRAGQIAEDCGSMRLFAVLAGQNAAIDAVHDAAEYFARKLCLEHGKPRGTESAIEVIEELEPRWWERLAHMPKLLAAIEAVHREEHSELDDPALSAHVVLSAAQAERLTALLDEDAEAV